MKTTDLRDKVVLTTGATSGIGAAIAREAAARGAISLLVGRNAEKLAEVEHSIRCKGGRSKAYVCNLTNAKEIELLASRSARKCLHWANVAMSAIGPTSEVRPCRLRRR